MKTNRLYVPIVSAFVIGGSALSAADAPSFDWDLRANARYESAQQDGLRSSDAMTLGTDLGAKVAWGDVFKAGAQLEHVVALDGDDYNQAGLNPGGAGKAVIADPEITELNQLWVSASVNSATATLGRQIIIFDNARFVGNVGWRQNMQTFDAVRFDVAAPNQGLTFHYAYLDKVLRILGRDHPAGEWSSDSHLFNVAWKARPDLTVTGYSYLLEFANAAANSTATNGISLVGKRSIDDGFDAVYRLEYAHQTDLGNSPVDYTAHYWAAEIGFAHQGWTTALGYEDLGADAGVGFKTPLATGHAFNGWADRFLGTPGVGLADLYLRTSGKIGGGIKATVAYHDFSASDGNSRLGTELNIALARPITPQWTALMKWADYNGEGPAPDVTKLWLQVTFQP